MRLDVMLNLRLGLHLSLSLDVMRNLRLGLRLSLSLDVMRNLRLGLVMLKRLMDRLAHRLVSLRPLARRRRLHPAKFELHQPVYRIELGPEILELDVVLALQLLDELFELRFLGADLFFQKSGPVLQVPANVTHCCPSFMSVGSNDRAGLAGSRKTERTLPGRRARQVLQGPGCVGPGGLTSVI
ncbi:MAG: hypothetical protein AB7V40_06180 [Methyloceanibacter sp.]